VHEARGISQFTRWIYCVWIRIWWDCYNNSIPTQSACFKTFHQTTRRKKRSRRGGHPLSRNLRDLIRLLHFYLTQLISDIWTKGIPFENSEGFETDIRGCSSHILGKCAPLSFFLSLELSSLAPLLPEIEVNFSQTPVKGSHTPVKSSHTPVKSSHTHVKNSHILRV